MNVCQCMRRFFFSFNLKRNATRLVNVYEMERSKNNQLLIVYRFSGSFSWVANEKSARNKINSWFSFVFLLGLGIVVFLFFSSICLPFCSFTRTVLLVFPVFFVLEMYYEFLNFNQFEMNHTRFYLSQFKFFNKNKHLFLLLILRNSFHTLYWSDAWIKIRLQLLRIEQMWRKIDFSMVIWEPIVIT